MRAARDFHEWIQSGVLVSEHEAAIYPYYQEYEVPGQPGVRKERRGFIALLRLEDYCGARRASARGDAFRPQGRSPGIAEGYARALWPDLHAL